MARGRRTESPCALSLILEGRETSKRVLDSPYPQRIPSLAEKTGPPTNSSDPGQVVTEANWKSQQSVMGSRRQKQLITFSQAADS